MPSSRAVEAGRAFILIEAIDKTGKVMRNLTRRTAVLGQQLMLIGKQLSAMGGALALPLTLATRATASFTDEMLALEAIFAARGQDIGNLETTIRDLGRSTSFTAQEIAAASTELARGGFSPAQVENTLDSLLALARAGRVDIPDAARQMVRSMSLFGIEAENANMIADQFFMGSIRGTATVDELATALSFTGQSGARLGFTFSELVATLSALADSMLIGTKGGTSLNNLLTRLATESEKVREVLGFNVFGEGGELRNPIDVLEDLQAALQALSPGERTKALNDIFNIRGTRAGDVIVEQLGKIRENLDAINNSQGTAEEAAKKMDSGIGGTIRRIKSAFDELGISIGKALQPMFVDIEKALIPVINGFSEFVQNNPEAVREIAKLAGALIGAGAALVTLGVGLAGLSFLVSTAFTGFASLKGVFLALIPAIAAGSVAMGVFGDDLTRLFTSVIERLKAGDLNSAFALVIEGLGLIWDKGIIRLRMAWEGFIIAVRTGFVQAMDAVQKALTQVVTFFTNQISGLFTSIANSSAAKTFLTDAGRGALIASGAGLRGIGGAAAGASGGVSAVLDALKGAGLTDFSKDLKALIAEEEELNKKFDNLLKTPIIPPRKPKEDEDEPFPPDRRRFVPPEDIAAAGKAAIQAGVGLQKGTVEAAAKAIENRLGLNSEKLLKSIDTRLKELKEIEERHFEKEVLV